MPSLAQLHNLVGHEVGVSPWLTVTQEMITAFADLTGDRQWIHVDPQRAERESPYKGTIAHGFLTLALITTLHQQAVPVDGGEYSRGINYGLNKVRFPQAVRAGMRIRARSVLKALEAVEGGVQLTWSVTVEIEGETKPAVVAEWIGRAYV